MSVSQVTWQLTGEGDGTWLVVTDQIVSLVGDEMIAGSRAGMTGALDNLATWLAGAGGQPSRRTGGYS